MHVIKIHCFSIVNVMFTCFEGQTVYYIFAMEEITVQTRVDQSILLLCHLAFVWLLLAIGFQEVVICLLCYNTFLVLLMSCCNLHFPLKSGSFDASISMGHSMFLCPCTSLGYSSLAYIPFCSFLFDSDNRCLSLLFMNFTEIGLG